ncbi:hypothetical protein MET9862_02371 [Methylobacterium symbioticum]|uniref:Uncharacterized protein n=1 Tax=Methylobacterium symbioticum TaxID=2584084 RepID=A0A509EEY1_9HYPH|nr:hypothetical protein MET9862_02371 [Methylobacterium symbioticum]
MLPVSAKFRAPCTRLGLVLSLDDVNRQFMHRVRQDNTRHTALGEKRYSEQRHGSYAGH